MIKVTSNISVIVPVIATLAAPFLAERIDSLTYRDHATQRGVIGINSSLVWRQRRDIKAYVSGFTVQLTWLAEVGVVVTLMALGIVFLVARAFAHSQAIVYLVIVLLVLVMTWWFTSSIGRSEKRYRLELTKVGFSPLSADFLYDAKFLRRNAIRLGASIAFPVFLVMYTFAIAGTINRVVVIGIMVVGLALLITLIVGYVQSIRIVKDQLFLRAAILSTNRVVDDTILTDRGQFVFCKCALCTVVVRVSSLASKIRAGIWKLERESFRRTAKRLHPSICSQPCALDLASTGSEDQQRNDVRVLYDAVLLKDGQTMFKVVEVLEYECPSDRNRCVAKVDIHYLRSNDIEQTASDLAHCDQVSRSRVALVWYADAYDTKLSKFFRLSLKQEESD